MIDNPDATRKLAQQLLDELNAGWLSVCKVPGRDGGYVRIATEVNAEWYRRFCRRFETSRRRYPKPRTIIKRCHTKGALEKIVNHASEGVYVERLLHFMEEGI